MLIQNGSDGEQQAWIGVSLGSAYSTISTLNREGRAEVIANADGERQIASCVTFTDYEQLAGTQARQRGIMNPKNMIVRFLDLLGRNMDDEVVSHIQSTIPVTIGRKTDKPNVPVFEITSLYGIKQWDAEPEMIPYTALDITTRYLSHLLQTAQNYLGKKVDGCVMSIPVDMTDEGGKELRDAALQAGFPTQQFMLIREPSAAALAFYHYPAILASGNLPPSTSTFAASGDTNKYDATVFILDFGANHFTATILSASKDLFTTITSKTINTGGSHIDKLLAQHFASEFQRKTKMDVTESRKSMLKLQVAVESCKRLLSRSETGPCHVDTLHEGVDFNGSMHRGRLDMLIEEPVLSKCIQAVKCALVESNLSTDDINQVLLVGGSSRIPKFQSMITSLFNNSSIDGNNTIVRTDIEPDEATALGCAIQALISSRYSDALNINYTEISKDISLYSKVLHVCKTIGIEATGGGFVPVIPRHTPIPARRSLEFTLASKQQRDIYLAVYEGDDKVAKQNTLVAEIVCSDLGVDNDSETQNELDESLRVEIIFTIEKDLVLRVSVSELSGPRKGHLTKPYLPWL
ncbi:hypothetical protein SeMB42_g04621 [Synchytrium endobioticum]|uniref:Uncharacterized protein n=1 Tax=Synchytrium endobioticum TaxID=286115 RepID=A0A507D8U4_9FUNG|nr:hypothetical protein SeMB42_g04621 [Synchytrium endobioticum]TPX47906.1 hypothetical protein SeLEV6574_g02366 [Synchytrium endobioticum]